MTAKRESFVFGLVLVGVFLMSFSGTAKAAAPAAPIWNVNFPQAESACAVDLSWNESDANANYFNVVRQGIGETVIRQIKDDGGNLIGGSGEKFYIDAYDWNKNALGSPDIYIEPGDTYKYKIRSCNSAGECSDSILSGNVSVPGLPSKPGTPTNVSILGTSPSRLDIGFDATAISAKFASYGGFIIYRDGSQISGFVPSTQNVNGRYFYDDGGANRNTSYAYEIKFYESDEFCKTDKIVNGAPAPQVVFSDAVSVTVPVAPSNLTADYDKGTNKNILSWLDNAANETGFLVERSTISDFSENYVTNTVAPAESSGSTVNFEDTNNVNPSITYYYRVRAYHGSGGSSYGDITQVFTATAPVGDLKSFITYSDYSGVTPRARVLLTWTTYDTPLTAKKDGNSFTNDTPGCDFFSPSNSYLLDCDVPFGKVYSYEVGKDSGFLGAQVDLNIYRILRGEAWAMVKGTQGIGWVSFNSSDLDDKCKVSPRPGWCTQWLADGVKYSVQVDQSGLMSGAAWASAESANGETRGYGWLSFNKGDLSGCPAAPCEARMNISTGQMNGWARFTGAAENPTPEWDGWVSLGGDVVAAKGQNKFLAKTRNVLASLVDISLWKNFSSKLFTGNITDAVSEFWGRLKVIIAQAQTGESYGIYYQPLSKRFSGAGWGGAIIGWVAFGKDVDGDGTEDCPYCSVRSVNRKPVADDVRLEEGNLEAARGGNIWCAAEPYYKIKFGYEDADNDPPYQADIEFRRKSDGALALTTTNFSFDCSPLSYVSPGATCSTSITDPLGYVTTGLYDKYLDPNTEYYVKVRIADGLVGEGSEGLWTSWAGDIPSVSSTAKTPTHYYPFVSFAIDPDPPVKGAIATSTDTTPTTVAEGWLGGNGYTIIKREWRFEKANPSSVTNQTTVPVVFYALPSDVTLTVTDSENNACTYTRSVGAGGAGTGEILKRRVFRER